jgi:hypothetical protein
MVTLYYTKLNNAIGEFELLNFHMFGYRAFLPVCGKEFGDHFKMYSLTKDNGSIWLGCFRSNLENSLTIWPSEHLVIRQLLPNLRVNT